MLVTNLFFIYFQLFIKIFVLSFKPIKLNIYTIQGMVQIKSIFEQISQEVFQAKDLNKTKKSITEFIESKGINKFDKVIIIDNINKCTSIIRLQTYVCNSLLKYEGYGVTQLVVTKLFLIFRYN